MSCTGLGKVPMQVNAQACTHACASLKHASARLQHARQLGSRTHLHALQQSGQGGLAAQHVLLYAVKLIKLAWFDALRPCTQRSVSWIWAAICILERSMSQACVEGGRPINQPPEAVQEIILPCEALARASRRASRSLCSMLVCFSMVRLRSMSAGSCETALMRPRVLEELLIMSSGSASGLTLAPVCLFISSTACTFD